MENFKSILTIASVIAVTFSGYFFLETRSKTIAENVVSPWVVKITQLDDRLTLNELRDLLKEALDDLYYWRKMHRKYPEDEEIKRKLDESEERVKKIEERIEELEN